MPVRLPFPVIYVTKGKVTAVEVYSKDTCTRFPHIEKQEPGEWLAAEDVAADGDVEPDTYSIIMHEGKVSEVWWCPAGGYWDTDLEPDEYAVMYDS